MSTPKTSDKSTLSPSSNLFSTKNIASLQLYYKSSIFTRLDLLPFLFLYSFCYLIYFKPQIPKDLVQNILNKHFPLYADWNLQVYAWSLFGLWLVIITSFIHIINILLEYWHLWIRCIYQYKKIIIKNNNLNITLLNDISIKYNIILHVIPPLHCGQDELCELKKSIINKEENIVEYYFIFQSIKYIFNEKTNKFEELTFPIDEKIEYYVKNIGLTDDDVDEIFCVGLWCLDEYWMYSLFTLFMLVVFEVMMVKRRMGNMKLVRNMRSKPFLISVYRNKRWIKILSNELVPEDIISLVRFHKTYDISTNTTTSSDSKEQTIVPCDALLLQGTCVVDEALLTGESVPQIKEALDLSGTKIVISNSKSELESDSKEDNNSNEFNIPLPPDNGCICYVLKTGFNTSQGELLRTILFSTSRVSVNNPEAFVFIGILLIFAICASSYVLYWGLKDETRSYYKLALNCIMIITSVVPPELPMELSLAVNNSLVKLLKQKIFCTEAFRIPFAGAVEICCFDKTGTLTSDQFQVVGITKLNIGQSIIPKLLTNNPDNVNLDEILIADGKQFSFNAQTIIGGCHSLINLDNNIIGDPLEKSALLSMNWQFKKNNVACPKDNRQDISVKIYHRFSFLSSLKRMSCIVTVSKGNSRITRLVCKGAAEVIGERLKSKPGYYDYLHQYFSRQGFRVLALAYKDLNNISINNLKNKKFLKSLKRNNFENKLNFSGFIIFACPNKPDSLDTIIQLKSASCVVIMITGDHVLTACAVGRELNIADKNILTLQDKFSDNTFKWYDLDNVNLNNSLPVEFNINNMKKLSNIIKKYDLCLSGKALKYLIDLNKNDKLSNEILDKIIISVKIYARTSPSQKEYILSTMKRLGIVTLMCGDGTNDVGALKQAHVGVALLSQQAEKQMEKQEELRRKQLKNKQANAMNRFGFSGIGKRIQEENEKKEKQRKENEKKERMKEIESLSKPQSSSDLQKKLWANLMDQMEGDPSDAMEAKPVQLGDASIASPFTSKRSTILSCISIIRQGRCTLVTTLQMYSILALNCLISAYSLSVLYLDGVKYGDTQMTITGIMIAALFFFVTQSEPQEYLSKQQPNNSIFSKYLILSLFGQMLTHLFILYYAVQWAKPHTPTDEETRDPRGKFKPNVLNTVVFLVQTIQIVATFAANYAGAPFMISMGRNKKLNRTIMILIGICFANALNFFPEFNEYMQISPLPSDEFRNSLALLMVTDLFVVVGWERFCRNLFKKDVNQLLKNNISYPKESIVNDAKKRTRLRIKKEQEKIKKRNPSTSPWAAFKEQWSQASRIIQERQQEQMRRTNQN